MMSASYICRSPRALQDKIQQAKEHLGEWGLRVNDAKTQCLEVRRGGHVSGDNVST